MPTYDYRCNACGHEFELFQSFSEGVKKKCPECKKLKLERLIGTGAGMIFKGAGFYETDYRSDSYKKGAEADKQAKADSKKVDSEKTSENTSSDKQSASPKKAAKKKSAPKKED